MGSREGAAARGVGVEVGEEEEEREEEVRGVGDEEEALAEVRVMVDSVSKGGMSTRTGGMRGRPSTAEEVE